MTPDFTTDLRRCDQVTLLIVIVESLNRKFICRLHGFAVTKFLRVCARPRMSVIITTTTTKRSWWWWWWWCRRQTTTTTAVIVSVHLWSCVTLTSTIWSCSQLLRATYGFRSTETTGPLTLSRHEIAQNDANFGGLSAAIKCSRSSSAPSF